MILLIADDEMIIRKGLRSLPWTGIGIQQIYEAENGLKAKEILQQNKVDIVISDIKMPGFTGLELAEYVRENSLDIGVILLTGFSDFSYAQQAIHNGVYEYMLKPIRPKDILAAVSKVMKELEKKRYQEKITLQYETEAGGNDFERQILYQFRNVNIQTMDILQDIVQGFMNDITLNSVAEKHHFSHEHVSRMIKRETGYSFSEIVTGIRLLQATQVLTHDNIKIELVSGKVGFRDPRYFSQVFKKVFECSPREYKKKKEAFQCCQIREILDLVQERK